MSITQADDNIDFTQALVRLFSNDVAPLVGNTIGVYDECNFPGYRPLVLGELELTDGDLAANWQVAGFMPRPIAVYGIFVTLNGTVIYAERFPESVLSTTNDSYTVVFPVETEENVKV